MPAMALSISENKNKQLDPKHKSRRIIRKRLCWNIYSTGTPIPLATPPNRRPRKKIPRELADTSGSGTRLGSAAAHCGDGCTSVSLLSVQSDIVQIYLVEYLLFKLLNWCEHFIALPPSSKQTYKHKYTLTPPKKTIPTTLLYLDPFYDFKIVDTKSLLKRYDNWESC